MVVFRLRRGTAEWDPPDLFYDLAGLNDQSAPCGRRRRGVAFGGGRYIGDVPFKFATSDDSGATWTPLAAPRITRRAGFVEAQPSSAFRSARPHDLFWQRQREGSSSSGEPGRWRLLV